MMANFYKNVLASRGSSIVARITIRALHDASPLSGVTVLDLTRIVAGPYCTMSLGDLGATVIKVERPGGGDEARKWGPPFIGNTDETCYFLSLNRNKRSICVDLKAPKGLKIIEDLAAKSDVLVENYVPGKLDELGLGYEDLRKVAPRLIYCSVTGYGPDGPYSDRPGYDVIAAGFGGLLGVTGEEGGGPVKVGVPMTDIATGLYAYGSIMAALLARQKTGRGQKLDCSLLATQISCMINLASNYLNAGKMAVRRGTAHESIVPYQAFRTRDGHLVVGAGSNDQFGALCRLLNVPELAEDDRFRRNIDRVKNRTELLRMLENIFAERDTSDWLALLEGAPFPYGPVNDMREVFDDPHVKHLDLVKEINHPVAGDVKIVGPPVRFGDGGNFVRSPPPTLGQHTIDILKNMLNYSDKYINTLKEEKEEPPQVAVVTLKKPRSGKKVEWTNDTVDNENMNKKKSKCCCIYKKKKKFGESDSEDSADECDNCSGHVERRNQHHHPDPSGNPPPPDIS